MHIICASSPKEALAHRHAHRHAHSYLPKDTHDAISHLGHAGEKRLEVFRRAIPHSQHLREMWSYLNYARRGEEERGEEIARERHANSGNSTNTVTAKRHKSTERR